MRCGADRGLHVPYRCSFDRSCDKGLAKPAERKPGHEREAVPYRHEGLQRLEAGALAREVELGLDIGFGADPPEAPLPRRRYQDPFAGQLGEGDGLLPRERMGGRKHQQIGIIEERSAFELWLATRVYPCLLYTSDAADE